MPKRNRKGQFVKGGSRRKARKSARRNPVAAKPRARRNPIAAAPVAAAKPNPRRRVRRASRSRSHESKSARSRASKLGWRRRKAGSSARRNPWHGESKRHAAAARKGHETRRARANRRQRAEYRQRTHKTRGMRIGRNETLIIRSNPMGMLGTVAGAVVMGGIGYTIADVIDRYLATRAPKATATNTAPKPLTGMEAANAIQHLNWGRIAIEGAIAVAGVAGGLYLKKGMFRTAAISFGLGAGVKTGADILSKALVPALFGGKRDSTGSLDLTADTTGNRLFPDLLAASSQADQAAMNKDVYGGLRGAPQDRSGQAAGCGGAGCQHDGTSTCICNDCKARRMATDVWNRIQAQQPNAASFSAPPTIATSAMNSGTAAGAPASAAPAPAAPAPNSDFAKVLNFGNHPSRRRTA